MKYKIIAIAAIVAAVATMTTGTTFQQSAYAGGDGGYDSKTEAEVEANPHCKTSGFDYFVECNSAAGIDANNINAR
jgi:hypothetical protein